MVTLISQDLSEFALHVRAILGLPIPSLRHHGSAASCVLLAEGHGSTIRYHHVDKALQQADVQLRLFGKPEVQGERRVGVVLSLAEDVEAARKKARMSAEAIRVEIS
jgi:phosphoribosylglycinamide formyltransferase 2